MTCYYLLADMEGCIFTYHSSIISVDHIRSVPPTILLRPLVLPENSGLHWPSGVWCYTVNTLVLPQWRLECRNCSGVYANLICWE